MVINESSDLGESCSSSDRNDLPRDTINYAYKMFASQDKVDKRLIELYRIGKAHDNWIDLGFKNPRTDNALKMRRTRNF